MTLAYDKGSPPQRSQRNHEDACHIWGKGRQQTPFKPQCASHFHHQKVRTPTFATIQ